ncbi:MAG: sulfite exporter TauE/SafE family protein [Halobacteria archaeon]|nr:sulfite exporter TauE/SafE family protein [Halobacteria archaeon]
MVLGVGLSTVAIFMVFGVLIGVLFGFFGMGGSLLILPAILVAGYPADVAAGNSLAFVFGTAVISVLKHRDHGQIDYKLGAVFLLGGTLLGETVGHEILNMLKARGLSNVVVSLILVTILVVMGVIILRDARSSGDSDSDSDSESESGAAIQEKVKSFRLPPMMKIKGGIEISVWVTLAIAFSIGVLAGLIGVGGGFLVMPAMTYILGAPAAVAVGTDLFQIVGLGAYGTFLNVSKINLGIVMPLLAGSALGARVGASATTVTDGEEIKEYFAVMLLISAVSTASKLAANQYGIEILNTVSIVFVVGAAFLVTGVIIYTSIQKIREESSSSTAAVAAD